MNTTIIWEEVQWLLEAIKEQYEIIRKYEDRIPQIELDMLLDNVKKLYEKIHLAARTNDPFIFTSHPLQEPIQRQAEGIIPSTPPVPGTPPKPPVHAVRIQYEEKKPSTEEPGITGIPNRTDEMDLFSSPMQGFNGKLQEARQQNIPTRAGNTTRHDLKTLISINEKFLFINELFDGNLREYNENIESLNNASDSRAALEFLDVLRKKNLWNSESSAFLKLRELLARRFSR
jgi:hypothetical protein